MKNIKLTIEFDGTNYVGSQRQKSGISVQEAIEKAIFQLTEEKVNLVCCSRTDSGVHAEGFVANFISNTSIQGEKIKYALNNKLPADIYVLQSEEVSLDFHARYSAIGKTYVYLVNKSEKGKAIKRNYCYFAKKTIDVEAMKEAAQYLIGKHDFSAFKNVGGSVKTSVRNVTELKIEEKEETIKFTISADGFLYKMVRIIVGTLIEIGYGRRKPESIKEVLESGERKKAGKTAPPEGLYLKQIYYNY